jgi:hypothetical protein
VVRISISQAAFDALPSTPFRSVWLDAQANQQGERIIWLPLDVVEKLYNLRGPGESFSDAILQASAKAAGASPKPVEGHDRGANDGGPGLRDRRP